MLYIKEATASMLYIKEVTASMLYMKEDTASMLYIKEVTASMLYSPITYRKQYSYIITCYKHHQIISMNKSDCA